MTLRYLDFDYSEDNDGVGTFEAMASTAPARTPEVQAEIAAVLDWARRTFPEGDAALADGAPWDHDLQELAEDETRRTFVLSLSGTPDFCDAFREHFAVD